MPIELPVLQDLRMSLPAPAVSQATAVAALLADPIRATPLTHGSGLDADTHSPASSISRPLPLADGVTSMPSMSPRTASRAARPSPCVCSAACSRAAQSR